jgi:hypothetical protein
MKPENAPPPMPERKDSVSSQAYEVSGFWTAAPQPSRGISSSRVVRLTS